MTIYLGKTPPGAAPGMAKEENTLVLRGRKAIASALGLPIDGTGWRLGEGRVRYLEVSAALPVYRDGRTICVPPAALQAWCSAREAAR